jgi:hypothetical protein
MNFYKAWQFLVDHKIYNIEYITKVSDLGSTARLLSKETLSKGFFESTISHFERGLSIHVVKVNPMTNAIDLDNDKLNTQVRIWLESSMVTDEDGELIEGKMDFNYEMGELSHDYDLDVGGKTFEEAIQNLAISVKKKYG